MKPTGLVGLGGLQISSKAESLCSPFPGQRSGVHGLTPRVSPFKLVRNAPVHLSIVKSFLYL